MQVKAAASVDFSAFHTDNENYKNISHISLLALEDLRFLNSLNREFPENSSFLKVVASK
jgi:hypothetical protein